MEVSVFEEVMKGCGGKVMPEFAEIRDGVKVRPELKTEDLRLIRKGFVALIRNDEVGKMVDIKVSDGERACALLKRMLRNVK